MRQSNSGGRSSTAKNNAARKDVEEYLAAIPEPARSTLNRIRAVIRSVVPPETTEAISYRIPTFKYKGPLVGLARVFEPLQFVPYEWVCCRGL